MGGMSTAKKSAPRILSAFLAVIMMLSIFTSTALAATYRKKNVNSSTSQIARMTNFKVTSGKGLAYAWGWKKTTVTVQNTGKYPVTVYERNAAGLTFWKGTLPAGRTMTLSMSGSNKTSTLYFQRMRGNTTISVSVNAGSVS